MADAPSHSFEYLDDISGFRPPGSFVAVLGGPLRRKADLLRALAKELKFPEYFGWNWDAVDECMRDLSWLPDFGGVVLVHKQLPLADDEQRRIYIDILKDALVAHEGSLRVIFPKAARGWLDES